MELVRRKDDLGNVGVASGWTTAFFARSLMGTSWVQIAPMALSTGLLFAGIEAVLRMGISVPTPTISLDVPTIPGEWLTRRWDRRSELEQLLQKLNKEIEELR